MSQTAPSAKTSATPRNSSRPLPCSAAYLLSVGQELEAEESLVGAYRHSGEAEYLIASSEGPEPDKPELS